MHLQAQLHGAARGLSVAGPGRLKEAISAWSERRRALEEEEEHAMSDQLAMAHAALGALWRVQGDGAQAIRHCRRALQLREARVDSSPLQRAASMANLAGNKYASMRVEITPHLRALRLADNVLDVVPTTMASLRAGALAEEGGMEEALVLYERSRAALGSPISTSHAVFVALRHVSTLAAVGRLAAAEEAMTQLLSQSTWRTDDRIVCEVIQFSGELWLHMRRFGRCEYEVNSSQRLATPDMLPS
jgi:tetratricopeptide (TPR) repeat protein